MPHSVDTILRTVRVLIAAPRAQGSAALAVPGSDTAWLGASMACEVYVLRRAIVAKAPPTMPTAENCCTAVVGIGPATMSGTGTGPSYICHPAVSPSSVECLMAPVYMAVALPAHQCQTAANMKTRTRSKENIELE